MLKVSNMKRLLLIISIFSLFLISCEESKLKEEASLIQRSELNSSLGFDWFRQNYNDFTPDTTLTQQIAANFAGDEKFVIFVKPTCGCKGTQFDFPHLVKIFDDANIPIENYEIWSCAKESYEHPYMSKLTIMDLPACYLIKNGEVVYSVLDSFNLSPANSGAKIEQFVLNAIKK